MVAARDHLGIEPLFYARSGTQWVFAETVEEILDVLPDSGARLNEATVVGHIAGPYAARPDATFFAGVDAVSPGTILRFSRVGTPDPTLWWDPAELSIDRTLTLPKAASRLEALLFEVVADYIPDAPVAVTLSSGMDSTTVLAALVRNAADVTAVVWTSPDSPLVDEAYWARLTAAHFGVPLSEVELDASSLLPEEGIVTRRSTPLVNMFDSVWIETAARVAAEGRQVLFTGFSGDHLFGGRVSPAADLLVSLRVSRLLRYLRTRRDVYPNMAALLRSEIASPLLRQLAPVRWARRRWAVPWLHPERHEQWRERQLETIGPGIGPGRADRLSSVTDGMIAQLSEALEFQVQPNGIELCHPLLDRRIVEFALSLPTWVLNEGHLDKMVLRHAMRGTLPDEVVELDNILPGEIARKAIRARADTLLRLTRDMRTADWKFVDEPTFAEHVAAFMRGDHDDMSFWNTLTLEDWLRRWW